MNLPVANAMGEPLDSERLQHATQKINKTWMKEKNKPRKSKPGNPKAAYFIIGYQNVEFLSTSV